MGTVGLLTRVNGDSQSGTQRYAILNYTGALSHSLLLPTATGQPKAVGQLTVGTDRDTSVVE